MGHFAHRHFEWLGLARLGVDLFFVLSGLLMARILFEKRTPIGRFYRHRIARILPAFWLFLSVVLTIEAVRGVPVTFTEVLSLLTFTRTYVGGYIGTDQVPIQHIWSLNVEEHCYLILSLVALIAALRKRAGVVLLGLTGLTFVAVEVHHRLERGHAWSDYLLFTECAASFVMASASYRLMRRPKVPAWAPVVALAFGVLCYVNGAWWASTVLFSPFLLAFAVNHLADAPAWWLSVLRLPALRWLGVISYSIYLWQQPFYRGLPDRPLLGAVLSIAAGCASFYLFENPVRRWLNANWQPATSPFQVRQIAVR